MTARRLLACAALVPALAVAACGSNAMPPSYSSSPAPSSSLSPVPTSSPVPSSPSHPKPSSAGTQTLTGTVAQGVEPRCLILNAPDGHHLLQFQDPSMRDQASVGTTVTVTGHADPTQMTYCQQGIPFVVTSIKPG
jgi:hypothetical protein